MKTKMKVLAQLRLLENLAALTKKLNEEIMSEIFTQVDAVEELQKVAAGKENADVAFHKMEHHHAFNKLEDGKDMTYPHIGLNTGDQCITVSVSTGSGHSLEMSARPYNEDNPARVSIGYSLLKNDGTSSQLELAYAEVKKGKLAEKEGLQADNQDIDFYLWTVPADEVRTEKYHLQHMRVQEKL